MKVRLIAALLAVLVLIGPGAREANYNRMQRILLPFVAAGACSQNAAGIAWMHGTGHPDDLRRYCSTWWYAHGWQNSLGGYLAKGGIPVIWCDEVAFARTLAAAGYSGPVIVMNEPDLAGQCNLSPRQAAVVWQKLRAVMPAVKMVGPNISQLGLRWLAEFLDEYQQLYGAPFRPDAWAFHLYRIDPTITLGGFLAKLCPVIGSCEKLWLTEFGACEPALLAGFARDVLSDRRLARYAYLTNRDGPLDYCSTLVDDSGRETALGRVYYAALRTAAE